MVHMVELLQNQYFDPTKQLMPCLMVLFFVLFFLRSELFKRLWLIKSPKIKIEHGVVFSHDQLIKKKKAKRGERCIGHGTKLVKQISKIRRLPLCFIIINFVPNSHGPRALSSCHSMTRIAQHKITPRNWAVCKIIFSASPSRLYMPFVRFFRNKINLSSG